MKKLSLLTACTLLAGLTQSLQAAPTIAINFGQGATDGALVTTGSPLGIDVANWTTISGATGTTISNGLTNSAAFEISFTGAWGQWAFSDLDITGNAADNSAYKGILYNDSGNGSDATITLSGMTAALSTMNCSGYIITLIESSDNGVSYNDVRLSTGDTLSLAKTTGVGVYSIGTATAGQIAADSLTLSFDPDNRSGLGRSTPSAMTIEFVQIPEPSTYGIIAGIAALGIAFAVRRYRKA